VDKREAHGYPLERGTVIQLDKFSFLLWTHGAINHSEIADGRKTYYKGKRGIPQPLFIRRFRGNDDINSVAQDILALTKMNWNTGEMYRILPATLDFSKTLSKVAKQTESLDSIPYDFRFFI
jgi:argonaute-like protein implicated in RNA metabolism and viral defense